MVDFKSFKIGGKEGLFLISTGRDIIIGNTQKGDIPLISHQHENNGIAKYIKRIDNRRLFNHKDTISLADRGVFLATTQCEDFHIGTRVKALTFKDGEHSERVRLYFVVAINKLQIFFKEYLSNATDKLPELSIMLPVDKLGKIDYDYMERYISELEGERISELEEERISELDSYLKVSGFDNYQLTDGESRAIESYRSHKVVYGDFKIGELFDIHPTKSYGVTNRTLFKTKGKTPVIVNSSIGNGIGGYVGLEPTEKGNMITYTDTTTSEGIFYQPNDFIGYSHIQGLYPLNDVEWSEDALLYFLAVFKKHAAGRFDYATKFNRKVAAEMIVKLPVSVKGTIDFEFMENFVQAQKKLSIKDVIDWKNMIITKTQEIVNK